MPSRLGFLTLPRELRDIIYHLHVFEPDGYHYDYKSSKLRTFDGRRIRLDFMYTCSTIAREMHGLALGSNVINFSTISADTNIAVRFDMSLHMLEDCTSMILEALRLPDLRRYKTSEMDDKLAIRYPRFEPLLRQSCFIPEPGSRGLDLFPIFGFGARHNWGEARSEFQAFQDYMFELLSENPDFAEALAELDDALQMPLEEVDAEDHDETILMNKKRVEERRSYWRKRALLIRNGLLLSRPKRWTIPSENEVAKLESILGPWPWIKTDFWKRIVWRFSAAATAIHFLKNLSLDALLGIRKIVLHEDRPSISRPESHVQGLIPFCRQNLHMRVERRVDVWKILLSNNDFRGAADFAEYLKDIYDADDLTRTDQDRGYPYMLGRSGPQWITEASVLHGSGMPAGSFSLILNGDPLPNLASEVFGIMKDDAAWQIAQMQWYADQSLNLDWRTIRVGGVYMSRVYPQIIQEIVEEKSFIRCNFPTNELHDPQRVLDSHRHIIYDPTRHSSRYPCPGRFFNMARVKVRFHTPLRPLPPLPSLFADLVLEDVKPEEQLSTSI